MVSLPPSLIPDMLKLVTSLTKQPSPSAEPSFDPFGTGAPSEPSFDPFATGDATTNSQAPTFDPFVLNSSSPLSSPKTGSFTGGAFASATTTQNPKPQMSPFLQPDAPVPPTPYPTPDTTPEPSPGSSPRDYRSHRSGSDHSLANPTVRAKVQGQGHRRALSAQDNDHNQPSPDPFSLLQKGNQPTNTSSTPIVLQPPPSSPGAKLKRGHR